MASRDAVRSGKKDGIEIYSSEWAGDSTRVGSSAFDYRDRAKLDDNQTTSEFGRFSTTTRNRPWNSQITNENHP